MEIYRDELGYVISLDSAEAADLKVACETPEYHLPILVKIANELARIEKGPTQDPGLDDSGWREEAAGYYHLPDGTTRLLTPEGAFEEVSVLDGEASAEAPAETFEEHEVFVGVDTAHGEEDAGAYIHSVPLSRLAPDGSVIEDDVEPVPPVIEEKPARTPRKKQ